MSAKNKSQERIEQHQAYTARPRVWRKICKANVIPSHFRSRVRSINRFNRAAGVLGWLQRKFYDRRIRAVDLKAEPPIFVLGHWRSGTTHLHYMFAEDPRLGYLTNYQCLFFNIAFLTRSWLKPVVALFFPKTRLVDNMSFSADKPGEDEQPLGSMTTRSGLHSFFFPKNRNYIDKYNFFKGIEKDDFEAWKDDFHYVVQNISLYNGNKPLVLKNPHHTGRVKAILELYPNAKFILPHRDPYHVFRSTVRLYNTIIRDQMLQDFSDAEIEDSVLYIFRNTMLNYLEQRELIPEGNLFEIPFLEFSNEPIESMERIYKELKIPGFERARPNIQSYVDSVKDYRKNKFTKLSDAVVAKINEEWGFFFEAFGYEKRNPETK